MNLYNFAKAMIKEAGFSSKLLKGGLVAGGAVAGAATAHAIDKQHEKKTAKKFYWLGRNTGK